MTGDNVVIRWLLFGWLAACATQCGAAVILSVAPAAQDVALAAKASFDINIAGLGNGTALGTYDIDVGFDPTVLAYSSATFGNQLDLASLGDIRSITPGTGSMNVFELSLDSVSDLNSFQKPSFRLATLTFDTLTLKSSIPITLTVNALGDAAGERITATIRDGSIAIVPEPTAFFLFPIGLAALVALKKRKRLSLLI